MRELGTDVLGTETLGGDPAPSTPSASYAAFPQILLEEAFTTPPLAESPAFVGLDGEALTEFTVTHNGRSSELDSPSAGGSSLLVDVSTNRSLDSTNPSSPLAPYVTPNRRTRLRIIHDRITYPIHEGFANGHNIAYSIDTPDEAFCELDTTDAFKILNRASLAGMPPRPKERADLRVTAILDWVGWPVSRRLVSPARTILSPEDLSQSSPLDALIKIDATECGRLTVDPSGNVVFLSRRDVQSAVRQTVPQAVFSDSGVAGTIPYQTIKFEKSETLIRNVVQITHPTGDPINIEDAASRLEYGPVEFTREVRDVTSVARRATAEHFLAAFSVPRVRVLGMTVLTSDTPPGYPTGMYGAMANLKVGDRVATERLFPPAGGDPFSQDCFIESKSDTAHRGDLEWVTTLEFSYAPPVVSRGKWGTAKWRTGKWGWS